jgi:pyrroloquinoline quinone (PQQ) biosynthesis protein C
MNSTKSTLLKTFNDHFYEFIADIRTVFPNDVDILSAQKTIQTVRLVNPRIVIEFWNSYILTNYGTPIEEGDLEYFITKDYQTDVKNAEHAQKILASIDRLRKSIQNMTQENKDKVLKYLQNLSKLAKLYFAQV